MFLLFLIFLLSFIQSDKFGSLFFHVKDIVLEQKDNLIGNVKSCYVDSDVGIIICDAISGDLKIYDFEGKLKRVVGRKGKGPGEFVSPFGVVTDSRFIYVVDPGLRRLSVFDKANLKFVNSFRVEDGRDLRVIDGKYFVAFTDGKYSLHIYEGGGRKIKDVLETPDVVRRNNFIADGISIDVDAGGNIYVVHEMEYKVYKLNKEGILVEEFRGENGNYVSPPQEQFREFYSREKIKKWAESWWHVDRVVVLKKAGLVLISLVKFNPKKFVIDIYDLKGRLLVGDIVTDYRLYCVDVDDNIYFVQEMEKANRVDFIIKKYRLKIGEKK
jgi:hypothetical protein